MTLSDPADPLFKYLNEKGYVPITVPHGKMEPPVAYIVAGDTYQVLRGRAGLVAGKTGIPGLSVTEADAVNLEEGMSRKASGKASVSFLSGILSKFGISGAPEAHAEAEAGADRDYSFRKVTMKSVEPGAVLEALKGYDPANFGVDYLEAGRVYIAYAYLYSAELGLKTGSHAKGGLGAKAGAEGVGSFSLALDGGRRNGGGQSSNKPVAFAVRLIRLGWKDGAYRLDYNWGEDAQGLSGTPGEDMPGGRMPSFVPEPGTVFEIEAEE